MRYEFAGFTLDDEVFELHYGGALIPVQRRVFDTIAFLIAHRDRVVTKDELVAGPWEGVNVSDAALDRAIMFARRALEPPCGGPQMIRTVRGRGYIWLSPVRVEEGSDARRSANLTAGKVPLASRFVGRAAELGVLHQRWACCLEGQGSVILIEGVAGVGKTRLVEQAAAIAAREGAAVVWGHSWEGGGAPALWPWIEALRVYLDLHDGEWRSAGRSETLDALSALLPELRPAGEPRDAVVEAPQIRFRIFDAVTQFFRGAARMRPLLIILEDVHAADDSSLHLLQFLARFVGDVRLLVMVTYREAHFPEMPLLSSIATGMQRHWHKVQIGGLGEDELRQLLETIVDNPPAAFISELHRNTEGNPFLSEQFARLALAEQVDTGAANVGATLLRFRMPGRVADAIRRHLEALAPAARNLLEAAAVVGRDFDVTLLSEIAALPTKTTMHHLEAAFNAALVRERGEVGRYTFAHALVRETIYRDLAPSRRNELHRRAALSLERLYEGAEDLVLPQLAYHYLQAASAVDTERCIAYATRAAKMALDVSAYELAADHYATAINALDLQGPKPERRVQLLLSLGLAQRLAGRSEEAMMTYDRAGELGASLRSGELIAEAALGVAETRREGVMVDPGVTPRLEKALAALAPTDSRLRARLLGYLAVATYHSRPLSERLRISGDALEMARRTGDRQSLVAALDARLWTAFQTKHGFHALELIDEMVSLTQRADDPEKLMDAKLWRIADLLGIGELTAMNLELTEYGALAQRYAHPLHTYWMSVLRTTEATLQADYVKASSLAKQSLDLGFPLYEFNARGIFATQTLTISMEADGGVSVAPMVAAILEAMPWFTPWRTSMALVYALTDRRAEAAKELHALAVDDFAAVAEDAHTMGSLANLARVAAMLGDPQKAEGLYRRLLPYRDRNIIIATAAACWGPTNYHLGLLAACMGHDDQAREHFESAAAESRRIGASAIAARIDFAYGRLLEKAPDEAARGRELVERARGFAERTGMVTLSREIASALSAGK